LHEIFQRGSQDGVVELDSLADGLSGPVEAGSVTIPMVKYYVDRFILVSETDIASAIAYAWHHYHERIEGSAAVPLAAILTGKLVERPAVLVVTGGNISEQVHTQLISPR
jgi:threonine dehydratase